MTNFVHALAVLEAARRPGEIRIHPHDAVEALAKAGLLAEDLPEPSYIFTECGEEHPVWETPDCDVELTPGEMIVNAHLAGLALLAAVNYQEEA